MNNIVPFFRKPAIYAALVQRDHHLACDLMSEPYFCKAYADYLIALEWGDAVERRKQREGIADDADNFVAWFEFNHVKRCSELLPSMSELLGE